MKLEGKTAVVTGAGSGIGQAIAESFAREGARVVTVGRSIEKLQRAREAAKEVSERLLPRAVDVSNRPAVRDLMAWAEQQLGAIDILVNNAGVNVPRRAIAELSEDDFAQMIEVNLYGAFHCLQEALTRMRPRRDGLIINIASIASLRATIVAGAGYSASKFGLAALSLSTGLEERHNGIRSCLICPGEVNTPILEKRPSIPTAEHRALMLQPEDVAQAALLAATLHPRATIPELVITPTAQAFA